MRQVANWLADAPTPGPPRGNHLFKYKKHKSYTFSTAGNVCNVPTVGALGEHLASLLWSDGDPLADRATNELLHGVFIYAFQLQVAVFFVTLQYTLAFKKANYAMTDSVDE
jgi:hypothetical protein